ncbi:hypothetical protein LIER_23235 [Lithospermum erythrorhizon]|uniref:Uncharacterized protein n=1 Tax=Lithospermum erythrorhizon TaxID=34254 RepID=A0AAV3QZA8_LITER
MREFNDCLELIDNGWKESLKAQMVIHLKQDVVSGPRPFNYHTFWREHPLSGSILDRGCQTNESEGTPLDLLLRKMEKLQSVQSRIFGGQVSEGDVILERNLRS